MNPELSSSQSGSVTSRREQIEAYLLRHYPCQAVPYGALKEVGERFGVTGERVRQIANEMGMGRLYKTSQVCPECGGRKSEVSQLCKGCRCASVRIALPCNNCGAPVMRLASELARRIGKDGPKQTPSGPASYSGNVYCNKKCFGEWLGHEHGWNSPSRGACP